MRERRRISVVPADTQPLLPPRMLATSRKCRAKTTGHCRRRLLLLASPQRLPLRTAHGIMPRIGGLLGGSAPGACDDTSARSNTSSRDVPYQASVSKCGSIRPNTCRDKLKRSQADHVHDLHPFTASRFSCPLLFLSTMCLLIMPPSFSLRFISRDIFFLLIFFLFLSPHRPVPPCLSGRRCACFTRFDILLSCCRFWHSLCSRPSLCCKEFATPISNYGAHTHRHMFV